MSNKPCPICASEANDETEEHGYGKFVDVVSCSNPDCPLFECWMVPVRWNTRPIEDELRAEVRELDAERAALINAGDALYDNAEYLPEDILAEWRKARGK